jgi:hypothetical protein
MSAYQTIGSASRVRDEKSAPSCATCRFYLHTNDGYVGCERWRPLPAEGLCRKRPPSRRGWPTVHPGDWCGSWEARS